LKGFVKVELQPGETRTVSIPLDFRAFAYFHPKHKQWITETGEFDILIAASAADIRHKQKVMLESTLSLPSLLDNESTVREWMADSRGSAAFGPFYEQLTIQSRKAFGGEDDGEDQAGLGMDIMDMFQDMPLVSVFMFQQSAWPRPAEDLVNDMLTQVHKMKN
jgi:beta-glucosidase